MNVMERAGDRLRAWRYGARQRKRRKQTAKDMPAIRARLDADIAAGRIIPHHVERVAVGRYRCRDDCPNPAQRHLGRTDG